MASVTSTAVNKTRTRPDGNVDIQYRFDLLDNHNLNHVEYYWRRNVPATHDADADMTALAPVILQQKQDVELSQTFPQIDSGQEPYFDGTNVRIFAWGIGEDYFKAAAEKYWSEENLLNILGFRLVWSAAAVALGSTALKGMFGISQKTLGDLNGDMQNAVNIQNMLDAHEPHYRDGVWS